jgi:hypothetical protein
MRIPFFFAFAFSMIAATAQKASSDIFEFTPAEYNRTSMNIKDDVKIMVEKHYATDNGKVATSPDLTVTYVFDGRGRVESKEMVGITRIKYSFIYDNAGRPTEIVVSGDLNTTYRFQYSQTGNVVTKRYLHKTTLSESMEYDSKGKLIKWVIDEKEAPGYTYIYQYEYNPEGSIKTISVHNGSENDKPIKYSYRFNVGGDVLFRGSDCQHCELEDPESNYYYQEQRRNWVTRMEGMSFPSDRQMNYTRLITRDYTYSQEFTSSYPLIQPETLVYLLEELNKIVYVSIPFPLVKENRKVSKISSMYAWSDMFSFELELADNTPTPLWSEFRMDRFTLESIKVTRETPDYYQLTFYYKESLQANVYSRFKPDGTPEAWLQSTDTGVLYLSKKADVNGVIKAFESLKIQ